MVHLCFKSMKMCLLYNRLVGLVYRHFQKYFSYIVAVNFIGGETVIPGEKPAASHWQSLSNKLETLKDISEPSRQQLEELADLEKQIHSHYENKTDAARLRAKVKHLSKIIRSDCMQIHYPGTRPSSDIAYV
jgi:hypothetical protein